LERGETEGDEVREEAQRHRITLAMATASMAAYIVQAVFNVQQVGLSFSFWLLIGCSTVIALAVGVPDTLRPRSLLAATPDMGSFLAAGLPDTRPASPAPAWAPRSASRRKRQSYGRRPDTVPWWTLGVGAVVAVVIVFLALGADGAYRADHDYWAAYSSLKQPAPGSSAAASAASKPTQVGAPYFADLKHAFALNPWEPSYPASEASVLTNAASHASSTSAEITDLTQAHALTAKATQEKPLWGPYPASEAEVDLDLSQVQPANAQADLAAGATLARQAIKDNPRDTSYQALLRQIQAAEKKSAK
jgi:hypothetical protein